MKAAAAQESSVLIGISEARARATQTTLSPADLDDPAKVAAFDEAQSQVGGRGSSADGADDPGALSRAEVELQNFARCRDQIEGTENRIRASRGDYNDGGAGL